MKHLLDVNVLLAAIWKTHPQHTRAAAWLEDKNIVLCPLAELGYLRISTNKQAINVPMADARALLKKFAEERKAERIADDLDALDSHSQKSEEVTDLYLADLAAKHALRLATLDEGINHKVVDVLPANPSILPPAAQ